ncbi:hypothetical protein L1887_27110 [Cichorium endivia]|nr:hypothetical protein L1887_27110 [Cichorium endivia]
MSAKEVLWFVGFRTEIQDDLGLFNMHRIGKPLRCTKWNDDDQDLRNQKRSSTSPWKGCRRRQMEEAVVYNPKSRENRKPRSRPEVNPRYMIRKS